MCQTQEVRRDRGLDVCCVWDPWVVGCAEFLKIRVLVCQRLLVNPGFLGRALVLSGLVLFGGSLGQWVQGRCRFANGDEPLQKTGQVISGVSWASGAALVSPVWVWQLCEWDDPIRQQGSRPDPGQQQVARAFCRGWWWGRRWGHNRTYSPGCNLWALTEWAGAASKSCLGGAVMVSARGLIGHPRRSFRVNHLQSLVLSL